MFHQRTKLFTTLRLSFSATRITKRLSSSANIDTNCDRAQLPSLLKQQIKAKGAITVAEYMKQSLNAYYGFRKANNILGAHGDFFTSPEVSSIFGELLAIWFYHTAKVIGNDSAWNLVELGPGKGTLMADVVSVFDKFGFFETGLDSIHLVELGEDMIRAQAEALKVQAFEWTEDKDFIAKGRLRDGIDVFWYAEIKHVPNNRCSIFLAHEFFDALPINAFKRKNDSDEWREVLVATNDEEDFEYVLSPTKTPTNTILSRIKPLSILEGERHVEISPESVLVVDEIGKRRKKLRRRI